MRICDSGGYISTKLWISHLDKLSNCVYALVKCGYRLTSLAYIYAAYTSEASQEIADCRCSVDVWPHGKLRIHGAHAPAFCIYVWHNIPIVYGKVAYRFASCVTITIYQQHTMPRRGLARVR